MTRNDDVLERLAPLSGAPSRGYDDLLRLRAKRQRARKIGAIAVVVALVVALVSVGLAIDDRSEPKPANPPVKSRPGTFTGLVVRAKGNDCNDQPGDLVTRDPSTGTVGAPGGIAWAGASADGRWFAFELRCPSTTGLWVTNGFDEPRLLTTASPSDFDASDLWAWSPTDSRLVTVEGDHLILIDPATGDRTDLGHAAGHVHEPVWSPDGTQIAYGTGNRGSCESSKDCAVYVVSVSDGTDELIAGPLDGEIPLGEEGSGIAWSPDGTRIAIVVVPATGTPTLYVMEADGSHGQPPLAEGVLVGHTLGTPNIAWSPDGTQIAYATISRDFDRVQVWSAPADGSSPVLVFDPTSSSDGSAGGPIWSPDGTRIAFRYDSHPDQRSYLIANADGTGDVHEIDELRYRGWRGGRYFCECYG